MLSSLVRRACDKVSLGSSKCDGDVYRACCGRKFGRLDPSHFFDFAILALPLRAWACFLVY